ncbi:MAG: hypothetical protein HYV09_28200 [Deltaproteobacteria bacterium]|nr:hypothetical protein [Deltaproteobacteria bacterium]
MIRARFLSPFGLVLVASFSLACGAVKSVGPDELAEDDGGGASFDVAGGDGDPTPTLSGLELDPPNAVITIDTTTTPPTAAKQLYKVTLNGVMPKDVSGTATLTLDDPTLGAFAGPEFTSVTSLPGGKLGITTIVRAEAEGKSGAANLTIIQLRKTGDKRDFFFTVPYMGTPDPAKDVLKFGTNIKQVDVAVTMDTTGSMGGSITNLKTNLSTTIFPKLKAAIPSVGLSVSYHDDFPVGSFGTPGCTYGGTSLPGDLPHGTIQVITTDLAKAQAAANKLETHCGADGPESQMSSMWHMLTGNELSWSGGKVAKHVPPSGTWGGVDFRPGSVPVVILITDINWHTESDYASYGIVGGTIATMTDAFVKNNARFVDITSGSETQANTLSDATKSNVPPSAFGSTCAAGQCCTGVSGAAQAPTAPGGRCRLNFKSTYSGTGVNEGIVKAIQAISVGSTYDVTAVPSNDPTNAPGDDGSPVDATQFIAALRAMDEGDPANGCPPHAAKDTGTDGVKDTFTSVVVGTPVCFEVLPKMNTTVKPKAEAQFFNAFIDVIGMPGSVKLDRRTVLFLVPPREITAK